MDMRTLFMVMVGCLAITGICSADFIGDTDGITVTATAGHYIDGTVPPENLVNGSGMTPNNPVTLSSTMENAAGAQGMWTSTASPASGNNWVLFTFSNTVSITNMVVWNYNQNADMYNVFNLWHRGLKDVVITYSTGADATGLGNAFYTGQLQCATGAAAEAYTDLLAAPGDVIDNVKAVMIAYTSNWGTVGEPNIDGFYGLSEVRFAVPEPATMVLLALGGITGLLRRRK